MSHLPPTHRNRGFRRIIRGADRDSYYHERFLRGRPDLRPKMKRMSATQCKTPASGNAEERHPDFNAHGRYVLLPDEPGNKRSEAMRAAGLVPGTEAVASSGSWNTYNKGLKKTTEASQIQPMSRSHTVSVSDHGDPTSNQESYLPMATLSSSDRGYDFRGSGGTGMHGMNMLAQSNADYNFMRNNMVSTSDREFSYGGQIDNMTSASVGISDREVNYNETDPFYGRSDSSQSQFITSYIRRQTTPAYLPSQPDNSQFNMARMPDRQFSNITNSTNAMPQYSRSNSTPLPIQMPVRRELDSPSTNVDEQLGNIQRIMRDNEALAARIKELEGRIGSGRVRGPSHGGMAANHESAPNAGQVPDPPGDFRPGRMYEETVRGRDPVPCTRPLNDSKVQGDCNKQGRTSIKSTDECLDGFEHSFMSLGVNEDNMNSFMSLGLSDPNLGQLPVADAAEEAELKTRSSLRSSRGSSQADDNMESLVSFGTVGAIEGGGDGMTDTQWFQLQGT